MVFRREFLLGVGGVGVASLSGCLGAVPSAVDHAAYSTAGDSLPDVEYDAVLGRARDAGYAVDGPYYVNAKRALGRPLEVPALVEQFGTDARVLLVQFTYSATRFFEADFTASDSGVRLAFFDDELGFEQPFRPTNLPPDEWLTDRFGLLFGASAADAADVLAGVKAAAAETSENFLTHSVDRSTALADVHRSFASAATSVTTSETHGDGWVNQTYTTGTAPLGEFSVVVPSARIVSRDGGHEYTVKLDRLGGCWLLVTLAAGETIPESEYRGVFREMFEALGLPADRIDEYDFEYTPSNW